MGYGRGAFPSQIDWLIHLIVAFPGSSVVFVQEWDMGVVLFLATSSSLGLIPSSVRRNVSVVDVVGMLLGVLLECCLTMSF